MPRLVRRDGVFYFRMAVPKAIVQTLRQTEIKTTLRTGDLAVARFRARRLNEAFEAFFRELVAMPEISVNEIDAHVRTYMQERLDWGLELARNLPGDRIDLNAEVIGLREDIKRLQGQLASQSRAAHERAQRYPTVRPTNHLALGRHELSPGSHTARAHLARPLGGGNADDRCP